MSHPVELDNKNNSNSLSNIPEQPQEFQIDPETAKTMMTETTRLMIAETNGQITAVNLLLITAGLMRLAAIYKHLSGPTKKNIVMETLRNYVRNSDLQEAQKNLVLAEIELTIGPAIESYLYIAKLGSNQFSGKHGPSCCIIL